MAATVAMTVVVTPGPPPSLDLHGTLTPAALRAAPATLPPCTPTLHRHTPYHHTLTLPPPPFPAGHLSDLLTGAAAGHPRPRTAEHPPHPARRRPAGPGPHPALPAAPHQRHAPLDAMTRPGAGPHAEQLHWRWHGPLSPEPVPGPAAGTGPVPDSGGRGPAPAAGTAGVSPQSPAVGGPAGGTAVPDSLTAFEAHAPARPDGDPVHAGLAAGGVRVGPAEALAAHTALPFAVTAHHDAGGGLVLTAVHDRARVTGAGADAAEILAQTARILRELPFAAREPAAVGDALALLDGAGPVLRATRPAARTPRVLRAAARAGAGTVCLLPPPEAPPGCPDALAVAHPGPQAPATLRPPADARTAPAALRLALARGEPLPPGGFTGAGTLACEVAERIASHGRHPPLVVIGAATPATAGGPDPVRAPALTPETAAAATARP
ncbi:hypothetical protein [Streptomyces sp. NPDC058612]|uniref:hypothetical protein n=1 Tax=Streptomyces sp. NPDC058612 TaxID=3346555 RepID=UPI0036696C64